MWLGLEAWQLLVVTSIIGASAALQATVGFGFALFAVPLLVWTGLDVPAAVTIVTVSMAIQVANGLRRLGATLNYREQISNVVVTLLGILVGVALLRLLAAQFPRVLEQGAGVLILAALLARLLLRPTPVAKVAAGWTGAAMLASGVLSGVIGMGGPPVVFWAFAHDWSGDRIRATIWLLLLPRTPLLLGALYLAFGHPIGTAMLLGLFVAPVAWLGSTTGLWLGAKVETERLRLLATALLAVTGASAILRPILGI